MTSTYLRIVTQVSRHLRRTTSCALALALVQVAPAGAQRSERPVRLARPAIGCPTLDAAAKVAQAIILQDIASAREAMAAGGCVPFKALQGVVADATDDALCVRAEGQPRCLWFEPGVVAPAGQSDDEK